MDAIVTRVVAMLGGSLTHAEAARALEPLESSKPELAGTVSKAPDEITKEEFAFPMRSVVKENVPVLVNAAKPSATSPEKAKTVSDGPGRLTGVHPLLSAFTTVPGGHVAHPTPAIAYWFAPEQAVHVRVAGPVDVHVVVPTGSVHTIGLVVVTKPGLHMMV